jgi:hypothetical protein
LTAVTSFDETQSIQASVLKLTAIASFIQRRNPYKPADKLNFTTVAAFDNMPGSLLQIGPVIKLDAYMSEQSSLNYLSQLLCLCFH